MLDEDNDDGLSDLFDDEGDEKQEKGETSLTPQKAKSLFKKTSNRVAHTPQSSAPPPKKGILIRRVRRGGGGGGSNPPPLWLCHFFFLLVTPEIGLVDGRYPYPIM